MHLTVLAAIASAVVVTAIPVNPEATPIPDFPDCPPTIIALLPGCIANPSNNCFANAAEFPQKCIEAIKKVYPALSGLPTAAVVAAPGVAAPGVASPVGASQPHRREAFDASKFPDCPAPVINLLPGCIASPSNTCFTNAPEFPQKCLEEIKKFYPALPGLPTAAVAAPAVAAPPHRREAFDASKFPDCPAPVINLLPGCIASPSNTCFANAPEFPQKCLEEIKKFYPALPGLPTATVAAPVGAAPPHRRGFTDIFKCPVDIINVLPGCIANPSDDCFADVPEECLEVLKKAFPQLFGLSTSGN